MRRYGEMENRRVEKRRNGETVIRNKGDRKGRKENRDMVKERRMKGGEKKETKDGRERREEEEEEEKKAKKSFVL